MSPDFKPAFRKALNSVCTFDFLRVPKAAKKKRSGTQFPGIVEDAAALNVNRTTLYRTLLGEWKLPGLLKRYHELKAKQAEAQ